MGDYISYWVKHADKFATALVQHLQIVGITLVLSLLLAALLTLLVYRSPRARSAVVQVFSAVYSIPSLALFALLIPVTGLGMTTTVVVLVAYNQYLLLRNVVAGIESVDASIIEAARGMGMSEGRILCTVQLPLAMPAIMAGIRLAVISTIGIATIAATINAGGLGTILFDGVRTTNAYKLVGGTLLCALLAVVANGILKLIENAITKRTVHEQ